MGIRKEINDVIVARGGTPPVNGGIAASIDALSKLPPSWNDLTDKPFYKSEETILDGTFEFEGKNGLYTHIFADENFSLVDGKSYTVIWDGEAYQCVATTIEGVTAIGNTGILGQADTGEPFYAAIVGENRVIGTLDTAANHTVKVSTETIKTLDPKYLPEGVGGGAFVVTFGMTSDGAVTADKTWQELYDAYFVDGKQVSGVLVNAHNDHGFCQLTGINGDDAIFVCNQSNASEMGLIRFCLNRIRGDVTFTVFALTSAT